MENIKDNFPFHLIMQNANPEVFYSFIQTQPIEFYFNKQANDGQTGK